MKTIAKSVLVVATLAATTMYAKSPNRQGTEVVHFAAKVAFTNDAVEPSASGSVQASEAVQGNADHESLNVTVKGLTPNTAYSLTGTTVSNSSPVDLDDFTTDKKGNAKLSFKNSGNGKKTISFPDGFLPLTGLAELDVVNGTSQPVLTASRDQVSSVSYMVKKPMTDLSGTGAVGTVDLSASTKKGKFSLAASGLTASTDYVVVINGNPVQTNTATAKGVLKINASPSPSDVLDANTVSLADTTLTTILTTTVP